LNNKESSTPLSIQAKTFVKALAAMVVQAVSEIEPKQRGAPFRIPRLLMAAAENHAFPRSQWLGEAMG
jgi:hypothetical protein